MDSDRFVVRALAARASRRETLQAAATLAAASALALVRPGAAEAHHARIPLGGACWHTSQCLHHAPVSRRARPSRQSVYCADNGFGYDGSLNCCRTGGGSCTRNAHCAIAGAGCAPTCARGSGAAPQRITDGDSIRGGRRQTPVRLVRIGMVDPVDTISGPAAILS